VPTRPPVCVFHSVSRVQKHLVRPIRRRVALIYRFCPTPGTRLHASQPASQLVEYIVSELNYCLRFVRQR